MSPLLALLLLATAPAVAPRHATIPSVSPDGHRVAYVSDNKGVGNLFIVDAEGKDTYRVTPLTQDVHSPGWSADSKSAIYSTMDGDTTRLWSLLLPQREHREIWYPNRIVIWTGLARGVRLSNDGRRVVYARGSWTRNQVVVANLDGSGEKAISDTTAAYWNMAWSPDDQQIAATRMDASKEMQIWILNADGSGARQLTHFSDPDFGAPQWPAWSPDGKQIAIQSNRHAKAPGYAWIWIVDVATGKTTNITPHDDGRRDETPSWFPDGKRLAFQSDRSGTFEIWTMGADGSEAKQLTR